MDQVAKHIKDLRKHAGLTQDGLAEQMHVTRQTVSSWETGVSQSGTVKSYAQIRLQVLAK